MRVAVSLIFGMWVLVLAAEAQTAAAPQFAVVSIKPGGDLISVRPERTAGHIRWTTQLNYLIGYAEHLDFSRVSGNKMLGSSYVLEATFDPAATDDQVRLMMKSLLADRFKMRAHLVTVETDGFALMVGKGGLKVKDTDAAEIAATPTNMSATQQERGIVAVHGSNVSMAQLAENLQRSVKTPVWDRTGLPGKYSFEFRYALDSGLDVAALAPTLATALQETLGLRMEKGKGPQETFVVDSISEPSDN